MKIKELRNYVTIHGHDLFGRSSEIIFRPSLEPGWWWEPTPGILKKIDSTVARTYGQTIQLEFRRYTLPEYEHIGILRLLGIRDVVISCPTGRPPYFGRALELYRALLPLLIETKEEPSYVTIGSSVTKTNPKHPNRFTKLYPSYGGKLIIDQYSEWKPLPYTQEKHEITEKLILSVMEKYPQGYPHSRYHLSRALSTVGIWKHHKRITWMKSGKGQQQTAWDFHNHRLADVLGALSLIHHLHLPSLHVKTYCGGHKSDMFALKQAEIAAVLTPLYVSQERERHAPLFA